MQKGSSTDINSSRTSPRSRRSSRSSASSPGGLTDPAQIIVTGDVQSPQVQAAIKSLQGEIAKNPSFAPQTQVVPAKDGSAVEVDAFFKGETSNAASIAAIESLRDRLRFRRHSPAFRERPCTSAARPRSTRLPQRDRQLPVDRARVRAGALVPAADGRVPLDRRAGQGDHHEPAVGGGRLRRRRSCSRRASGSGSSTRSGSSFHQTDAIEAWLPLFLFSILFGLSMDYHVFLLSRIREDYDQTDDNTESVAYGLRSTAGIITGAAIIMVVVFAGLRLGQPGAAAADGLRPGGRGVHRRHDRAVVPRAGDDAAARRPQLVPAELAGVAPELNVEGHGPSSLPRASRRSRSRRELRPEAEFKGTSPAAGFDDPAAGRSLIQALTGLTSR